VDIALLIARVLLAAIFVTAGLAKLFDLSGSRRALIRFGVPVKMTRPLGLLLPACELLVAAALIPRSTAWWGALGVSGLLILFITGIGLNLAKGNAPDCHCFGQLHSAPAGWPTLVRNGLLALVAGFVVWQGRADAGLGAVSWLSGFSTVEQWLFVAATVTLLGVGVETWLVAHLLQQNGRVLLRLDGLDDDLPTGQSAPGANAQSRQPRETGLPIGTPAPTFSLSGLKGEVVTLARLCASGKRVLLIFSDPTCRPRNALLPEIGTWVRAHSDVNVALISHGMREVNLAKATEYGLKHILLQQGNEVANAYGVQGTPSAVLIQSDGLVASTLAAGSSAIRHLTVQIEEMPEVSRLLMPSENREPHSVHNLAPAPAPVQKSLVGTVASPFRLPDLNGNWVDLVDFRGKDVILLFWSPGCSFCQRMLGDLRSWETASLAGAPQIVIFSKGGVMANVALGLHSTIVLDEGFTSGRAYGAHGTPAAILIDAGGSIASPLAVGARAIWSLADSPRMTPSLTPNGAPRGDLEARIPDAHSSDETAHYRPDTSKYHFAS